MRRALAVGAAAAAGVAYYHAQWPTSQVYGPTICRGSPGRRRIALTYDDGPNPADTPALLELLERHGAKATFFTIGRWAEREPALLREVQAAGHAIGNHTYTHPTMPLLSSAGVRRRDGPLPGRDRGGRGRDHPRRRPDADAASLRAPPTRDARAVRADGYVPVTWSITCYDWRGRRDPGVDRPPRRQGRARRRDPAARRRAARSPAADRSRSVGATEDTLERFGADRLRVRDHPRARRGGRIRMIPVASFISDFWNDQLVDHDRQWLFLVLLGFVGSFAFIRMSTRLMRSPRVPWWPGSVVSDERRPRPPPGLRDRRDDGRRHDQLRRLRGQPDLRDLRARLRDRDRPDDRRVRALGPPRRRLLGRGGAAVDRRDGDRRRRAVADRPRRAPVRVRPPTTPPPSCSAS